MVTTMDVFENRNYRLNRSMLSVLGMWPLQSSKERLFLRTTSALIIASIVIPEIIKFVETLDDTDSMIECLPRLALNLRMVAKFINNSANAEKMKILTNQIKESWTVRTADFEHIILERYAERGRLLTVIYTVYVFSSLFAYLSIPLVPIMLDFLIPLNESRRRIYPFQTEYFVDQEENYFYVLAHAWLAAPFGIGMIIAYDTMFAVLVHHACGIFAILGARLESIGKGCEKNGLTIDDNPVSGKDKIYDDIVACIKIHKKAVEMANLLESSGYVYYIVIVGVTMVSVTFTGFMMVTKLDNPGEALRFGAFVVAEVIHLFYLCWHGHVLVEHSEHIFMNAYNVDWYDISPRAQKLLILIMMRSAEPCQLTAGKIYVLSMEHFAAALKTSMSYFTVLLSMQ